MRKMLYMEFSIVAPMFFIASAMPGAIGLDEWRIQTVLFSSWALFALLGLHLRFCCSIEDPGEDKTPTEQTTDNGRHGYDAIGYLTYAIVVMYVMLFNALSTVIWYNAPFATEQIALCRSGARNLFIISGVFVLETVIKSFGMRFRTEYLNKMISDLDMNLWGFGFNLCYIAVGSFLVKILLFSGISNVNGLSAWPLT